MSRVDLADRGPLRALTAQLHGGLKPGQIAVLVGRAGVGKSAVLAQIGLQYALRGVQVLHLSLSAGHSRVRALYDELLSELAADSAPLDRAAAQVALERFRLVHASLGGGFGPAELRGLLRSLDEVLHVRPERVLLDGIGAADLRAEIDGWRAAADGAGVSLWAAVREGAEPAAADLELLPMVDLLIGLEPSPDGVVLRAQRPGEEVRSTLVLDPVTLLARPSGDSAEDGPPAPLEPAACTLYSGGASGAEAAFGEAAERHGVREVAFSFEGHNPARTVGRVVLDARALEAGDVSLLYVAHRLHRHWDRTDTLRKVLQSQWHVVSHAEQLFVVGAIQPDGTVHGGTGWSVELARRWGKSVWVFDQNHGAWFGWTGTAWSRGEPRIERASFAGTGTRFLNEAGRLAIEDLFRRSFPA